MQKAAPRKCPGYRYCSRYRCTTIVYVVSFSSTINDIRQVSPRSFYIFTFHIWQFDYDMRSHYVMTFSYFDIWRKVFHVWHLIARCMWHPMPISSRAASEIWHFHIVTFHVKCFNFDIWHFDYNMRTDYVMTFPYFDIWPKVFHVWHLIARCMWRPMLISSRTMVCDIPQCSAVQSHTDAECFIFVFSKAFWCKDNITDRFCVIRPENLSAQIAVYCQLMQSSNEAFRTFLFTLFSDICSKNHIKH